MTSIEDVNVIKWYHWSMRTTVNLSEPLLRNAKRRASERGLTLSALLEDALRVHLARRSSDAEAPFQLHTVFGKLVNPELDLDRTSALELLDDEVRFARPRKR
jgi:hypothetical protein